MFIQYIKTAQGWFRWEYPQEWANSGTQATAFSVARRDIQEKYSNLKFPLTYHSICQCWGYLEPRPAFISINLPLFALENTALHWTRPSQSYPCTTLIAHPWSAARKDCFNCSEWPYVKTCLVHNHPLFLHSRVIPWQMNTFFSKITPSVLHFNEIWHTCRCHWKIKNAKKCLKNSHYLWSYDPFKNAIFTHHASMNMLKFLLNSSFLCLWSHENEMAENC